MRAIITVIGTDKTGIIAKVSGLCYEKNINILDITQTIMQEFFTMVMLVDLKNAQYDEVSRGLDALARELDVTIRMQHEDIFNSMHKI